MSETQEQRGERAFILNEKVKEIELHRRAELVENIDLLAEILDSKLYLEILGDPEGQWAGYLGQLEVYYTRAEVNRYIKLKKKLSQNYGLDLADLLDIPVTRLETIARSTKDKESALKLIDIARVALASDWKDEINGFLGKPTYEDGHEHSWRKYVICSICGNKHLDDARHEEVKSE